MAAIHEITEFRTGDTLIDPEELDREVDSPEDALGLWMESRMAEALDHPPEEAGRFLTLRGANLSNLDLRGFDFSGWDLEGCNFGGSLLYEANFRGCRLDDTFFQAAKLFDADFKWSRGYKTDFQRAEIHGADFRGAVMQRPLFDNVQWHSSNYGKLAGRAFSGSGDRSPAVQPDMFRGARLSRPRTERKFRDNELKVDYESFRWAIFRTRTAGLFRIPLMGAFGDASGMFDLAATLSAVTGAEDKISDGMWSAVDWAQDQAGDSLYATGGIFLTAYLAVRQLHKGFGKVTEAVGGAFTETAHSTAAQVWGAGPTLRAQDFVRRKGNRLGLLFSKHRGDLRKVEKAMARAADKDPSLPEPDREILKSRTGFVMMCDSDNLAAAIEEIDLRATHGRGANSQRHFTVFDPEAQGGVSPTAVTWHSDGSKTATWMDGEGEPMHMVRYDPQGRPERAWDPVNETHAGIDAPPFANVAAQMRHSLEGRRRDGAAEPDDPPYEPSTHSLRRGEDGTVYIRDVETGKLDNPVGPAIRKRDTAHGGFKDYFYCQSRALGHLDDYVEIEVELELGQGSMRSRHDGTNCACARQNAAPEAMRA